MKSFLIYRWRVAIPRRLGMLNVVETFHNQLVGMNGLCYTAELRNPIAMKRLSELALLDDILAVDCHGYLESVRTNALLASPSQFSEAMKFQGAGASR